MDYFSATFGKGDFLLPSGLKSPAADEGVKDSSWFQVANLGKDILTSVLQYKTLNNQINRGQTPSTAVDQNKFISGQPVAEVIGGGSTPSWILWVFGGALLLLLVLKK